jgi:formate hydrogenlyase subunit 4
MKIILLLIESLVIMAAAPLVSGIIRKLKNTVRLRKGAGILQPYYNLHKLTGKDEVVSENASWIFAAAPFVVLASTAAAFLLVPFVLPKGAAGFAGDFIAMVFLLALGRFFLALAGLDTGSAFGGMGSSREMFLSAFAEPVLIIALFAVGLTRGSTNLAVIGGSYSLNFASLIAAAALFLVSLAETARIPVDNQETHLELTMIHEAMTLEYSGRSLALLELAAHIKQMLFFSLIALVILPPGLIPFDGAGSIALRAGVYMGKIALLAAAVALLEVSVAKMRLFRAVDFLGFAYVLSGMAVVAAVLGV